MEEEIAVIRKYLLFYFTLFFLLFIFLYQLITNYMAYNLIPYLELYNVSIISSSPMDIFAGILKFDLLISFILSLPFLLYLIYSYLSPALTRSEKRMFQVFPFIFLLAILGSLFGFFVSVYIMIPFFALYNSALGIKNLWTLKNVISLILSMSFSLLVAFELPVIIIPLVKFGIINISTLESLRPYIIVSLLVISAIITPPDVISQILTTIPLYVLYEGSILYSKWRGYNA